MHQQDADGIANSVDPDQSDKTYLSENVGSLQYFFSSFECYFPEMNQLTLYMWMSLSLHL